LVPAARRSRTPPACLTAAGSGANTGTGTGSGLSWSAIRAQRPKAWARRRAPGPERPARHLPGPFPGARLALTCAGQPVLRREHLELRRPLGWTGTRRSLCRTWQQGACTSGRSMSSLAAWRGRCADRVNGLKNLRSLGDWDQDVPALLAAIGETAGEVLVIVSV